MTGDRDSRVIRTFWHGADLGIYEELSLRSFVRTGHTVQLFAYAPTRPIAGVEWVDAAMVLPASRLFTYRDGPGRGSFAAFANLFRYKMLRDLGGTWVDADVLCLRPLQELPVAFAAFQDPTTIAIGVLRLPAGHPVACELYERACAAGDQLWWGQTGPRLFTEVVRRHRGAVTILPVASFYPVYWRDAWQLLTPECRAACDAAAAPSYALHWWNEALRRIGVGKERLPPAGSWLYERARDVLGIDAPPAWDAADVAALTRRYLEQRLSRPRTDPTLVDRILARLRRIARGLDAR